METLMTLETNDKPAKVEHKPQAESPVVHRSLASPGEVHDEVDAENHVLRVEDFELFYGQSRRRCTGST